MRTSFLLLALACFAVCATAQPAQTEQPAAVPQQAVPQQQAAPVQSTGSVDLAPLARDLASLSAAQASGAGEIRSALSANAETVQRLVSTVSEGLAKLATTDATQTSEASASSAEVKQRLAALEKEVAELKALLKAFTSAAPKAAAGSSTSDAVLAEIKADQKLILAQLANATSAWSWDHEQLLALAKDTTYTYSAKLGKFIGRTATNVQQNYPQYLAQARDLSAQSLEAATVYGALASQHGQDAHIHLSEFLVSKGVPKDVVHYAALSMLAVGVLIALLLASSILRAVCRCFGCCRPRKTADKNAANNNKKNKGAKPSAMGAGATATQ